MNAGKEHTGGEAGFFKRRIRRLIVHSPKRWTPADVEKALNVESPRESRALRRAVRALIDEGALQYTYRMGCSFLEPSVQGLVRISEGLVLTPPRFNYSPQPGEVVVSLAQGSAFGNGDHASTRLALAGIETAVRIVFGWHHREKTRVLDVGTGNGVLMIAAVRLGMTFAVGIDTDPCARFEARENVRINGLEDRIRVSEKPADAQCGPFSLVAANLRFPTLASMAPIIQSLTENGGGVVLSGIREEEIQRLMDRYPPEIFSRLWIGCDQGWCGVLFMKRAQ